jgi:hypothetical protein
MSKKPNYELDFSVPPGWVQLPVLENRRALRGDRKVAAWAAGQAQAMLGANAVPEEVAPRAAELANLTYEARARGAMNGFALYPPRRRGLVGILDVKRLVPDRVYPELTFDALRKIYAKPSADTVGDIGEEQIDLASGPALRVHRKRAESRDPTGQSVVMEGVTYAIRPPGITDAIVMTMSWGALQLGDHLAAMADAIAQTVKITPA